MPDISLCSKPDWNKEICEKCVRNPIHYSPSDYQLYITPQIEFGVDFGDPPKIGFECKNYWEIE